MKSIPNITFHPYNLEEVNALKALGNAFNIEYEIYEDINNSISERHKKLVKERKTTITKKEYIDWDEAKKNCFSKKSIHYTVKLQSLLSHMIN